MTEEIEKTTEARIEAAEKQDDTSKKDRREVVSAIDHWLSVNHQLRTQKIVSVGDPSKTVPIGTNLIGKTLTSIDTREQNQTIKVLLPYGGKSKVGAEIEKNTILFGRVTYSGKGEKVYLSINKALAPDGHEFEIEAQALAPTCRLPFLSQS